MRRAKKTGASSEKRTMPALTSEAKEAQMTSLAMELAEQRMRDGTASNAIVLHFLKQGTIREKMERDILEDQKELMRAKTSKIRSEEKMEELYADALRAFRTYNGQGDEEDEDDVF